MMEELWMFAISALLGLGCFGAAAWVVLNPETLDVDKIFSLVACLLLGLTFLGISAWMLFHSHLRALWSPAKDSSERPKVSAKKQEEAKKSAS